MSLNGRLLIYREIARLKAAMTDWSSKSFQDELFADLKCDLNRFEDYRLINPKIVLAPFLKVIQLVNAQDQAISVSMEAVFKFVNYDLIDATHPDIASTMKSISDAVTNTRFLRTDQLSDCLTLFRVIDIIPMIVQSKAGKALPVASVDDIMKSCLKICFTPYLNESLRQAAEQELEHMVKLVFMGSSELSKGCHSLLCILIYLCDLRNTDLKIKIGLSLLTVAFDVGTESIAKQDALLELIRSDLSSILITLMSSENIEIFASALQVGFLLFETLRSHLQSQLKNYLRKLSEIVVNHKTNHIHGKLKITLENIHQLWEIPGFIAELYTNYNKSLFNHFINVISAYTTSDTNIIDSNQVLANDILISTIEMIDKNCAAAKSGESASFSHNVARALFCIVWESSLTAFSLIFEKSSGNGYHRVLEGLKMSAYIAAYYKLQEICEVIVLTLCNFTNLLQSNGSPDIAPAVNFGLCPKAQAALVTLFTILHEHGNDLGGSRDHIIRVISQLVRFKLLSTLEKQCLDQIVAYTSSARSELVFLETFIDFLSTTKNLQSIITNLNLNSFCSGQLSFHRLSRQILDLTTATSGTELNDLQEATTSLSADGNMYFLDRLKEIISDYIKPVEIKETTLDNRKVLQVLGKNILISTILQHLESKLSNPNSGIEEVHFIVTEVIHIDAELKSQLWHGKNIVILTKKLKVHSKVNWDVSGQDNNAGYTGNAGTAANGHGNQGQDGVAGESGGNILIITDEIESPENLTLISNGGNGSDGQDGGHGKDGSDGKSLTKQKLIDTFPSVIRFMCSPSTRGDLRATTCSRLRSLPTVHENWVNDGDIFIRATNSEGNEIIFSMCIARIFSSFFQAFLFYGGSPGEEGCSGGENGLGGQGGYAGDVTVRNLKTDKNIEIATSLKNGTDGKPGKGGKYGNRGKNGNDMGYVDYQTWSEAVYCDNGRKYKLQYFDKNNAPSDSVWCPRKQQYTAIRPVDVGNKKVMEEKRRVRVNTERKHNAQAERKKNISQNSILNRYSQKHASLEKNSLQNMRSDLLNTEQQASQAITENKKEQQTHTAQLRIQRGFSYLNSNKPNLRTTAEMSKTTQTSNQDKANKANKLVEKLLGKPQLLPAWYNLKTVELSSSQLEQIFPLVKNSKLKNNRIALEKILLDKYRYVTLHAIARHLQPYRQVAKNPEMTPTIAARYLIPKKDDFAEIHHSPLGSLNEYLFEKIENTKAQRKKIIEFYKKYLKNNANKPFNYSMRAFVLEVGKSDKTCKKYYDKYQHFLEKQKRGYVVFPESFNNLDNSCCNDKQLFKDYLNYMEKEGTCSGSYRELLAYIFDANIRVYKEADNNELFLLNCHNPTSSQYVHALCRGRQYVPLQIDKNYLGLEEDRNQKDSLYKKILKETESFEQKLQFDDYLNKGSFDILTECGNSEISEHYPSEQDDIEKIIKYFPEGEDQQILRNRLEAIKFRFMGQQGVIHNILERFSTEGRHISFQELYYLTSSVMTSRIKNITEKNTFSWIVSAYPQSNWIDELILWQLENHFKGFLTDKSKWRLFLSKIANKDILLLFIAKLEQHQFGDLVSVECIGDILYLLSNIPNEAIDLGELGLSEWPYLLKEKYWSHKLTHLTNWTEDKRLIASYYLLSMENIYGTELVETFLISLGSKSPKLSPDTLTNILVNFGKEKWNLGTLELEWLEFCTVDDWIRQLDAKFNADQEDRDIVKLIDIIKGNANTSSVISENLTTIENAIKDISKLNRMLSENDTEENIKDWVNQFRSNADQRKRDIEARTELLAIIDRAIKIKKKFWLRDTQRLSILALLTNNGSTLAQVSTGEGKSLIVVAISIIKALFGEKVHIITSSSVLAKRDAEENADLYSMFDIKVSHNCNEDIDKRKEAYSNNQVIYGDLGNFQRDYLLDRFYGKNILGDHNFKNVIVDEVDSMLLDNGNNMLYLSHDLAGFNKLESLYVYIWQWINQPTDNYEDAARVFDPKRIKRAVIYDLYGVITAEDIQKLDSELTDEQRITIYDRLVRDGIIDDQGRLLKQTIEKKDLEEILVPEFSLYQDRLNYLLNQCINRTKCIHVPNHLRPFVEQHLESWVNSAVTAFFMKAGHDYVVDVDRTGTSSDRNANITIIDRDTGTDQANSQWDEALHQFLQLKHGCKLSLQTLKAVFVSNVSFFKLYSHLYGLTGTLGSQVERDLLRQIHEVEFVTIPTAKSKKFHEYENLIFVDSNEWITNIQREATKITQEKRRSVLIICETVNDVETLHKAFGGINATHVHIYRRDYEEFDIAKGSKALEQGHIIIATNLAGRGTDIKLTNELRNAGGLHVCLTYLPKNKRIEQQAFGRAARSGDPGSGQLVIWIESDVKKYGNAPVLILKRLRDNDELHRISDIKKYYETQIMIEERCFEKFSDQYKRLKLDLEGYPDEMQEILLQSCLDKWAFWIDTYSKRIKYLNSEQDRAHFNGLLNQFISDLQDLEMNDWLPWIGKHPVHMIKLGKYYTQNNEKKYEHVYDQAIELFDKAIQQEPNFSEAAHYYKAFALSKKINWSERPLKMDNKKNYKMLKQELRVTARLLEEHGQFSANAAGIIGKIKKNNKESMVQVDAYEEQHKCLGQLYSVFTNNIDGILGHPISAQSFVKCDISEETAHILFQELLRKGILKNLRIRKDIPMVDLKSISSNYKIPLETLTGFLSRYQGKQIDQKEFGKALKHHVPLSSREAFWKFLIEKEILNNQIKYVILKKQKLEAFDSTFLESLEEKVSKNVLETRTLRCEYKQIFLRAEQLSQHNEDDYVFEKADFLKTTTIDKYQLLKNKGIIFSNRKADTDVSKISASTVFSSFDSITLIDFINLLNMTEGEAEHVFAQLIDKNVIAKQNENDNLYRLNIEFDKFQEIEFPSCPIYEIDVKGLLSVCFAYRIALQKLVNQLEEDCNSICLPLMTRPHQMLLMELLEDTIIKPVTVNQFTKNQLSSILERLGITKEDEYQKKLIDSVKDIVTKPLTENPGLESILDKMGLTNAVIDKFTGDQLKNIGNALGLFGEDPIFTNINSMLKQSISSLKSLKCPDSKLNPLAEFVRQYEYVNVQEVHVFFLNGFDHLIQMEEEKWSREMIINTAIVFLMGTVQIAIGVAIEYFSVGCMAHVGSAFISEGISDMFFAASALSSGYFDWNDYRQHKIESIMYTALTVGVAAYFSGASAFKYKLGTQNGAKMSAKSVGKELLRRTALQALKGIAFGFANAGVDYLIQNHMQKLAKGIGSQILSNIDRDVENHKISKTLETAYRTLGKEKARKLVEKVTKSVLNEKSCTEKYLPIAIKVVSSVTRGIAQAANKTNITGNNTLQFAIHKFTEALVWLNRLQHITEIDNMTESLLNSLDTKLKHELQQKSQTTNQADSDEDCEDFKRETIYQWKQLLNEKVGQIVLQNVVSPIMKEGANYLVTYVGNSARKVYQSYKQNGNHDYGHFDNVKKEYKENQQKEEDEQQKRQLQTEREGIFKTLKHFADKFKEDLKAWLKSVKCINFIIQEIRKGIAIYKLKDKQKVETKQKNHSNTRTKETTTQSTQKTETDTKVKDKQKVETKQKNHSNTRTKETTTQSTQKTETDTKVKDKQKVETKQKNHSNTRTKETTTQSTQKTETDTKVKDKQKVETKQKNHSNTRTKETTTQSTQKTETDTKVKDKQKVETKQKNHSNTRTKETTTQSTQKTETDTKVHVEQKPILQNTRIRETSILSKQISDITILSNEIVVNYDTSPMQRLILNNFMYKLQSRKATQENEQTEEDEETQSLRWEVPNSSGLAQDQGTGTGGDRDPNQSEDVRNPDPDDGIVRIPANIVYESILSGEILLSQDSISDHTRAGLYIGKIAENMLASGYNGDPIRAVLIENKLVVLDHRRLLAAAVTQSSRVMVPFKVYLPEDNLDEAVRGIWNAGEAVRVRMSGGNVRNYDGVGFPSSEVRIRTAGGNSHPTRESTENTLRNLNFWVGPRPRSNSIAATNPASRNNPKPDGMKKWSSNIDLSKSNQDGSNNI